ncbi:MAG: lamin tail domain-containing protein [Candidatus Sumerlaeia bacterium]|nr:lamin tail domain-containing protein [Candidatus Sumerlaeia bacterium]
MSTRAARCLGLAGMLLLGAVGRAPAVVLINEFMAVNTVTITDETGRFSDWIELYNGAPTPVDLSGYYMTDVTSEPRKWRIPAGITIAGYGYLLIWANGTSPANPSLPLHASFRLSGEDGEAIALYAADGATTVDVIRFGQQAANVSYGRRIDGYHLWGPFKKSTPRAQNALGGYTPPPARLAGILFINEWLTSNTTGIRDETGKREDWFEIYNNSDVPIDLGGYYLTDKPLQPTKFTIPPANVIGPKGVAFFWADDDVRQGPTHVNFRLSDTGETIAIHEKSDAALIDQITFGKQTANVSQGRMPDGAAAPFVFFSTPTPRALNQPPPTSVGRWEWYR